MFQNVEDLKNEIEVFRNNMNRSNGSIALVSEAIEKLNSNLYTLKQISEKLDLSKNELESKICALESNQKNIEAEIIEKIDGFNKELVSMIDKLDSNQNSSEVRLVERVNSLDNELESKICTLESNQKNIEAEMINKINGLNSEIKVSVDSLRQHMQSQLKTIKILGGIIIALLVLSVVLSFII